MTQQNDISSGTTKITQSLNASESNPLCLMLIKENALMHEKINELNLEKTQLNGITTQINTNLMDKIVNIERLEQEN